jgi:ABC-type sulfate/molybdate transport systems ATPase subunit
MGANLTVSLEVQIEMRLPDYTLNVAFQAGDAPLSILGPSAAGKTMTLRAIAGLERPSRGRIVLNGRVLFDSDQRIDVPARHRRVAMLFQHYALFPHMTVAANILFGLQDLPPAERLARLERIVSQTHLAGLQNRYPRELSGGEQQRVALARALVTEPEALLLDEPLAALDTHLRAQIEYELLQTFQAYRGATLLVTHNIAEAYRLGENLLVLSKGRIAAFGPKKEVFTRPASLEVARLTGCKNFSRARAIGPHEIEALDWGCRLRTVQELPATAAGGELRVGIRAHHISFVEPEVPDSPTSGGASPPPENTFPAWLVRSSEAPFGVTIYFRLDGAGEGSPEYHLQAEVSQNDWRRLRERPQPWQVSLPADSVFVMGE